MVGERDPALNPRRERCGDAPHPAPASARLDMLRQPLPQADAACPTASEDRDRRKATPGRADRVEPGGPRIVIGAGHAGRRRRHQPRRQPQRRPRHQPHGNVGIDEIDANMRWQRRQRPNRPARRGHREHMQRGQPQPHHVARRKRLDPLDSCSEGCDRRFCEHPVRHALGAPPDQPEPDRNRKPANRDDPRRTPMPRQRDPGERHRERH